MGRPSKLTPERHQTIIGLITRGLTRSVVARAADIHPQTITDWERRGATEMDTHPTPKQFDRKTLVEMARTQGWEIPPRTTTATLREMVYVPTPYTEFSAALKKAEALWEAKRLGELDEISSGGQVVRRKTTTTTAADGTVTQVVEETFSQPKWQGKAWQLERRYPERYGRPVRMGDEMDEPVDAADAGALLAEGDVVFKGLRSIDGGKA